MKSKKRKAKSFCLDCEARKDALQVVWTCLAMLNRTVNAYREGGKLDRHKTACEVLHWHQVELMKLPLPCGHRISWSNTGACKTGAADPRQLSLFKP